MGREWVRLDRTIFYPKKKSTMVPNSLDFQNRDANSPSHSLFLNRSYIWPIPARFTSTAGIKIAEGMNKSPREPKAT